MQTLTLVVAFAAAMALSTAAEADSANWSAEKAEQVDTSRNSDAGIGNGGERKDPSWRSTVYGEDGPLDRDPGGSFGRNQACSGGSYESTSC